MARKVRAYTDIGFRIAELGKRQRLIAKVLRVSQQTVSKKLRGETAILLSDLQKLASHHKVPMTHFFAKVPVSGELAAALERVKKGPAVLRDLVTLASHLPTSSLERVHELAKFVARGPKGRKGSRRGSAASRAAEDAGKYGK